MDNPVLQAINQTFLTVSRGVQAVPGSDIVIGYIKNSYQNDPFRVVLELGLAIYAIKYMLSKKYRIDPSHIKLTEKEIDELVDEWQPEPLVKPLTDRERMELESAQVILGSQGPKPKMLSTGKTLLNLASSNFLGYNDNEHIKSKLVEVLHNYGVGTCGPPGFYGTLDVHMQLEKDIARFLGTESAIIYAQAFATISSVVAAFSKRGDIIVADEGCNFAIQKGTQISRSIIKWYKHNDMEDLERVLESIQKETSNKKRPLTRRFIITEGLFYNYGDFAPLKRIMELKHKYKYRLVLDESASVGLVSKNGRGLTEKYGVAAKEIDMIVGSMAHSFSAAGGFCAGAKEVIDHQRLSGQAFVFSAAIPAMLTVCASEAINILEDESMGGTKLLKDLHDNATAFRNVIVTAPQSIEMNSEEGSPILHLRFPSQVVKNSGITTRDDEEYLLQEIVDEVATKDGLLITRAKYVESQELFLPRPSIRISICASHTRKEVEKAAQSIKTAFSKVIAKRK
ncbi:serine palmitoyltransferase component [Lunasporangiospora selenospora]|uniref:serine C-palmitoyltransferase n=1 Tax=Lunasporangiospora selenospora TaxID=979761 RepID=A0A9P6KGI1_9FUNG|nr:serine palmitoyltransferase component [Lunasporangiospora selenospora]